MECGDEAETERSNEEIDIETTGNETVTERVKEPEIGLVFDSIDELEKYYKSYGKGIGFEVCKRTSSKGDDGELKYITFTCSRFGKPSSKSRHAFKLRPVAKSDCKAKLNANLLPDGKWLASSIVLEHNHDLSTPSKRRFYKNSRELPPHVKKRLATNDIVGIRPKKNFNSFVVEAGGHENITFLEKDVRNFLDKVRRLRLGEGDATAIQKYFLKMQVDNSNFSYLMDINEEGRLRNVFWADARSRAAYEEFGDAVTFDTTY
ncbi:protein FAR-RED IMPAIRED RESPONSE 1-like [Rosa chinensis]|uniref:protein FAR-RED IMPAIRED RESPONSE 1-like n=1 Tax=Rosa chinensis TaxID=74649 RepID=UPI000D08890A|nr:protein FAR-RED IMPAIRED RESPONSE 1-like [Rosa chinensis]